MEFFHSLIFLIYFRRRISKILKTLHWQQENLKDLFFHRLLESGHQKVFHRILKSGRKKVSRRILKSGRTKALHQLLKSGRKKVPHRATFRGVKAGAGQTRPVL